MAQPPQDLNPPDTDPTGQPTVQNNSANAEGSGGENGSFFRNFDAIVVSCMAIGSVLATAGYLEIRPNSGINQFILVMGLGFLFGALGSTAKIGNKVWSMGGGAAIGVILGLFLNSWTGQTFSVIQLRELPKTAGLIASADDENIPLVLKPSPDRKKRTAKLVLTEDHFKSGILSFQVLIPAKRRQMRCVDSELIKNGLSSSPSSGWKFVKDEDGETNIHSETDQHIAKVEDCDTLAEMESEITFECVEAAVIKTAISSQGAASLLLTTSDDMSSGQLELNGEYIAKFPTPTSKNAAHRDYCQEMRARLAGAKKASLGSFMNSIKSSFSAFASNAVPTEVLIEELQSGDSITRRNARDDLARIGLKAIRPMMTAFSRGGKIYRTRIGVLVAINKMLLNDPSMSKAISGEITDQQLSKIARYTGDKDSTIRNNAQSVLSRLDDPRTPKIIVKFIPKAHPSALPSMLELLKGEVTSQSSKSASVKKLDVTDTLLGKETDRSVQKIAKEIEAISAGETAAIDIKFFVMTGSFSTQSAAEKWRDTVNSRNPPQKAKVVGPRPGENLYKVVVGDYVDRKIADRLKGELLKGGIVGSAYLSNYPYVPIN